MTWIPCKARGEYEWFDGNRAVARVRMVIEASAFAFAIEVLQGGRWHLVERLPWSHGLEAAKASALQASRRDAPPVSPIDQQTPGSP